ncbi:beta-phosphoglucomutase family hydrolase [Umezawaea sp. Da 62-37]|uniref:HAD family hydrolase n=1 Tax=Umezawaea sp. Da 62-37 TaxID=3075927 RepID=UPI0028F6C0B1|nr:beta-phosphoglucomutase family hydrolase [Umezawaea sp. Da 62-37]WNV87252.1 beta-phosphoglucomutase family hydrolase [Umezawaea sp. Da 62-37]
MRETVGLPAGITACLFDLDGVLTNTAELHRKAWKATFDEFLRARDGEDFSPFTEDDYLRYVDGRLRVDGVRGFLDSRGISLPEDGAGGDSPTAVATRKNDLLEKVITEQGVTPYPGSLRYLEAVERAGLAIGVVTSSANGERVLEAADLSRFVRVRIDGVVIERDGLRGKPAPDAFLAGARGLGVEPGRAAVFEDALSGVEAGRAGGFGHVVGVDRTGQAAALHDHGADVVVPDLAELLEPAP